MSMAWMVVKMYFQCTFLRFYWHIGIYFFTNEIHAYKLFSP